MKRPTRRDSPGSESYTAFVRASSAELLQTAWLLTGDRHRAEDLVQEVLVKAYARWTRVEVDNPRAYVRRMLVNARTDRWRRLSREHLTDEPPEPRHRPAGQDAERAVDERDDLVRRLTRLSRRERQVVVLRYYLDLSVEEVADHLSVSAGTVKSTASRALARLRVDDDTPVTPVAAAAPGPFPTGRPGVPPPVFSPATTEGTTR